METAEQLAALDAQPEAFYRPSRRNDRVRFTPKQQEKFNRVFARREAKIRAEYEPMLRDLLDTVEVTQQLLARCKDRISAEDQVAILDGVQAIKAEYEGMRWQKQPK